MSGGYFLDTTFALRFTVTNPNTTQPHIHPNLRQPPMIVRSRDIVTNYLPSIKIALVLMLRGSN